VSSMPKWIISAALVGGLFTSASARAGIVVVSRETSIRAAVVNDKTNIEHTKGTTTLADFDDSVSVFDDVNNTGNATVSQTSKLTVTGGQLTGFSVQGDGVGIGDGVDATGVFHLVFDVTSPGVHFTSAGSIGGSGQAGGEVQSFVFTKVGASKPIISEMPFDADVNFGKNGTLTPGRYDVRAEYVAGDAGGSGSRADFTFGFSPAAVPVPLPPGAWGGAAVLAACGFRHVTRRNCRKSSRR
jgi:hypothetical protein